LGNKFVDGACFSFSEHPQHERLKGWDPDAKLCEPHKLRHDSVDFSPECGFDRRLRPLYIDHDCQSFQGMKTKSSERSASISPVVIVSRTCSTDELKI
jgi:hypothetical protein